MDIGELLRAFPTKDIRQMLANLEETHRRETRVLRGEITSVAARMEAVEAVLTATDTRLLDMESECARQKPKMTLLQPHVEYLEDRERQNNLRVRGLPESVVVKIWRRR